MKIALAILHADPARGGAERYTIDLATALVARGHDVTLLSAAASPRDQDVPPAQDEPFHHIRLKGGGLTRTRRYRRFIDSLDAHIQPGTYDIVHAMLPVHRCDVYHPHAGIAAREADKPNALFNPRRRAMAEVERDLIESANPPVVICLSNYVAQDLHSFHPEAQTATLFNAVD
jgi:UDP-glucose:(heptosyl)LPS alpha-1,3-glucosyltransferase